MNKNSWLVPFKGRNSSDAYNQNFLWNHKSIYIMDNHRAALWCWLQNMPVDSKIKLFHIDQHYDTLTCRMDEWLKASPNFANLTIEEFLKASYERNNETFPIVRWDNYLSIFLEKYNDFIDSLIFCTHGKGNIPVNKKSTEIDMQDLPNNLNHFLSAGNDEWILNIDFDFFFCSAPKEAFEYDGNSKRIRMFSECYIRNLFHTIKNKYKDKNIKVITASLSPECCDGWVNAEAVCGLFCEIMELDFKLPQHE